jgi:hypothetical protein
MAVTITRRWSRLSVLILATISAALLFGLFRVVLHRTVARQLQETAQTIPGCTGIRYARLTIPTFTLQAKIEDAALLFADAAEEIQLQTVHIRRFRPGDRLPQALDAAIDGFQIDRHQPLLAPLRQALHDLDYQKLTGDLQIRLERRGDDKTEWEIELALRIVDAGTVALSTRLNKINADGVAMALDNPLNWLMVLPPVEWVQGELTYGDDGLFDRILIDAARRQGRPPEQVREALLQTLQMRLQTEKEPGVQAVWQSLITFCRQPGRITLRTRLPQPRPLGQLVWVRQPRDLIRRLAIESTVD